jgi:hypothetical protein
MNRNTSFCIAALCAVVASCASHDHADFRHISFVDDNHVAVHSHGQGEAIIGISGSLNIGGKPVALDAVQTQIAVRYFTRAQVLRNDAIKTGAAGVSTAATAIVSVAQGLSSGDTDSIDAKVNASAAKVEAAANRVCEDAQELAKVQDELAAALPAFKPYATIQMQDIDNCKSD